MLLNPDQQQANRVFFKLQPVFLTKQQREALKQKKEEQIIEQEKQKNQISNIKELQQGILFQQDKQQKKRSRSRSNDRKKNRQESPKRNDDRKGYQNQNLRTSNTRQFQNFRATIPVKLVGEDKEQQSIKMHYLCINKEQKKILRPSEKFKNIFNFEWNDNEGNFIIKDTSQDINPLYQNRLEIKSKHLEQTSETIDLVPTIHWATKSVNQMSERDWRIFREDQNIIIKGGRVPNPLRSWSCLPNISIQQKVKELNFKKPTAIQMQAIPISLEKKDLIGIAPTGSGKSLAFLIPMIHHLQQLPLLDSYSCQNGPYAIILTPTRELAVQIDKEFQKLNNTKIRSEIIVGGRKQEDQAFLVRVGVEVLIGTPGRMKDMIEGKDIVLNQCSWVILDEADKMIDMGFEEDVTLIMDSVGVALKNEDTQQYGGKQVRTTSLFSATMLPAIEKIARNYLRQYCFISIGEAGEAKKDITQKVEIMAETSKKSRLHSILDSSKPPIIIFANQQTSVESVSKSVELWGFRAVSYHGGKTQQQREHAIDSFKRRKYDILITTDLGGRGLDVEGVTLVVNYDAPFNINDFIHRTGRTGRAGNKGTAITFLTGKDEELFYDLKQFLLKNDYEVPQELDSHPASQVKSGKIADIQPRRKQVVYAQ